MAWFSPLPTTELSSQRAACEEGYAISFRIEPMLAVGHFFALNFTSNCSGTPPPKNSGAFQCKIILPGPATDGRQVGTPGGAVVIPYVPAPMSSVGARANTEE